VLDEVEEEGFEGSSVLTSNCHLSRVSSVSTDFIAKTRRVMEDNSSHSTSSHHQCRSAKRKRCIDTLYLGKNCL